MNSLRINTFSNILTKLWSMVSVYIFIPLYIKILGETAYGLVSFFATLQTTMNLLGLGLANTLSREFAVGKDTDENNAKKYKLLRSIEMIYFVLGALIIALCIFGSDFISEKWLNIESLNARTVATVISLMGISIALQIVANLYAGCLLGMNKQVMANVLCISWSVAKSVGTLLIIAFISPNLISFYGWHIFVDLIYLIALRISVVKKLKLKQNVKLKISDLSNIKSIWRYTCGILFISFIALVNKQLDKVIISKFLTLSELGAYNVATTLGSLTSIVPAALYTAIFPRFTNYATTNNVASLEMEFKRINKIVGLFISCMGSYIAIYALQLIKIWTGSDEYVGILGNVGLLVVLAVALIEYQEISYALALANGNTKYNVFVGGIFMPLIVISTYYGIKMYGLLGAGFVYFIMMLGQTCIYQFLVYKKYITKNASCLIFKDTIVPLIICMFIAYMSKCIINVFSVNALLQSCWAILCGGVTLGGVLVVFAKDELYIFKQLINRR